MKNKTGFISLIIIFISFAVSLTLYFVIHNTHHDRIFYYVDQSGEKVIGESRRIPKNSSREKNIEIYLSEYMLGPANLNLLSIIPAGSKVEALLLRDNVLYLDLNYKVLAHGRKYYYTFDEIRMLLIQNLNFNFPYLKNIVLTVNGEEPVYN